MSSLSSLYSQLRVYRNLYDSVQSSIRHLNRVIESSEMALKIKDYYLIDDVSADNYSLRKIRNSFIEKRQFLASNVIEAINQRIRSISREIEALELEEAERLAAKSGL